MSNPFDSQPWGNQAPQPDPQHGQSYGDAGGAQPGPEYAQPGPEYAQPYGGYPPPGQAPGVQPYGSYEPAAMGYGAAGYVQPSRKEPALMLLASFLLPGLGTLLNGEVGKGVGILVGYFVAVLLSFVLIGIPIALGLWIWGMIDAYQGAERGNRANGYAY